MGKKQEELPAMEGPGVSRPKIKEIEVAADKYVEVRDKRMALTEKEITARTGLIQAMADHKVTEYVYDDQKVVLVHGVDKVKVRHVKDETDDAE